jgi:hypothetical protein
MSGPAWSYDVWKREREAALKSRVDEATFLDNRHWARMNGAELICSECGVGMDEHDTFCSREEDRR